MIDKLIFNEAKQRERKIILTLKPPALLVVFCCIVIFMTEQELPLSEMS
jgi:hypothetical protein